MATWRLSTLDKKSAETHTLMSRDDTTIKIIEGFRWGKVYLTTENDDPPKVDLGNPDGVNTILIEDTEWELESFDDGWFSAIEVVSGSLTDEELEELKEIFDEDNIFGLEEAGWIDEGECEWWFFGPLKLENVDDN